MPGDLRDNGRADIVDNDLRLKLFLHNDSRQRRIVEQKPANPAGPGIVGLFRLGNRRLTTTVGRLGNAFDASLNLSRSVCPLLGRNAA